MARYSSRDNEPIAKWNGFPIYLTTIIMSALVLGLAAMAIFESMGSPFLLEYFAFQLPGNWFTPFSILTYPFLNRIDFFSVFSILFFYNFSLGIESHIGRMRYAKLLVLLSSVPALICAILYFVFGFPAGLMGDTLLFIGLIIAFSTLYPNAEAFGWVPFKWVAFMCLCAGSLMYLAKHNWTGLAFLWLSAGAAFLYMRHCQETEYDDYVPVGARIRKWFRRKPSVRVLPTPVPGKRTAPLRATSDDSDGEIDALLDKIAKSGLSSLSNSERAKLERARQELLKKEQH